MIQEKSVKILFMPVGVNQFMKFRPSSELKLHCSPNLAISEVVNVDVSVRERVKVLCHSYTTLLIRTHTTAIKKYYKVAVVVTMSISAVTIEQLTIRFLSRSLTHGSIYFLFFFIF